MIEGSSKAFYPLDNNHYLMTFKDGIHGNQRASSISGTGALRKEFTYYFYRLLERRGIKTHLSQESLQRDGIIVKKCLPVKIEILVRNVARGHWVDEHKVPLFEAGQPFDLPIVEFCLKIKKTLPNGSILDDPRINPALAIALNRYAKDLELRGRMIETLEQAQALESLALEINAVYKEFLEMEGWILEDFKFETGFIPGSNEFILIDEISPDSSRVRDKHGNSLTKDLFRQKKPDQEILEGYIKLREAVCKR